VRPIGRVPKKRKMAVIKKRKQKRLPGCRDARTKNGLIDAESPVSQKRRRIPLPEKNGRRYETYA